MQLDLQSVHRRKGSEMSDERIMALEYLSPNQYSFWRWDDANAVITWKDGQTIAFAVEIDAVVKRLNVERLPPLDLIVLLLSACRDNWLGDGRDVVTQVDALATNPTAMTRTWSEEVVHRLHRVAELPRDLRTTAAAKAELAAVVFEQFRVKEKTASTEAVLNAFREGELFVEKFVQQSGRWSGGPLTVALRAMCYGLNRIDADSLALRLRTGLDSVPTLLALPLEEEEPEPSQPLQTVRELLEELRD
ncbi:MAG: hypothetical protein KDA52_22520, partial [Planctomycetaceae bacterium]|nr:hypothetical protein [Planctomycetaceae bacterium]